MLSGFGGFPLILGAPILRGLESMSKDVQICEPTSRKQPVGVLLQAAISHLGKAEFQLDHADHMLDARTHLGFFSVPGALRFVHNTAFPVTPVGAVARVWRLLFDDLALVRIPIYPPMHSNAKPPTDSDLKPPGVPI